MDLLLRFQQQLEMLALEPDQKHFVVGYSGGLDSHVLLHLCKRAAIPVRAVYIHHGLQAQADDWSKHCERECKKLDLAFKNIHVDAQAVNGEGPENAARIARYKALRSELKSREVLLTAHHRDDQSETLLLQLLRGAGPAGLAAMPVLRNNHGMQHARPLLEISRAELLSYAKAEHLNWIEDPSNQNTDYDRNLLRQNIVPELKQRWPQLDVSLSQVAQQQQQVLEIIEAMAAVDLAAISTQQADVIVISALKKLSTARQLNVLRYWTKLYANDVATANILHQLVESVLTATDDAGPVLNWGQSEIRRYQDGLYLLTKQTAHDVNQSYAWAGNDSLLIEPPGIALTKQVTSTGGITNKIKQKTCTVRFRQGGEKIQPAGRKHTHSLKKLMQEAGIPPWQRSRIPLLYINDQLVCVCGYWIAKNFAASHAEAGWVVEVEQFC